jgi:hypothetical protein
MIHTTENSTANQPGAPNYKAKLDEAALGAKNPPEQGEGSGIIDKGACSECSNSVKLERQLTGRWPAVSQYIPVVGKMLGKETEKEQEQSPAGSTLSGPPERTKHDTQIEEFIKDQHLSKKVAEPQEPREM